MKALKAHYTFIKRNDCAGGGGSPKNLKPGDIVCLFGDLGQPARPRSSRHGSRTQGDPTEVRSPTFVLMNA